MSFEGDAIDRPVENEGRSDATQPFASRTRKSQSWESRLSQIDHTGLAASESRPQDSHNANPIPFCSPSERIAI
jgi:hypothetical protein